MRPFAFAVALLAAASAGAANVTFVTPLAGSQAIGPQRIEVTTDAANVDRVEFYVDAILVGVARTAPYRVAYDFGSDLRSREISVKVLSNGFRTADTAKILTAALTAGDTYNVDLVEVPLRIRASRTIRAEDLRVRENTVEQSVRELTPGRGPAHFAFVVDRSLSMGDGKLAAALHAVDAARAMLRPDDTASLVVFNHNVGRAEPLTRSTNAARSIVPSGGTSLRDAVSSIASRERTYAIVITDGGDRNSALSDESALRKISGTKTTVAALVFGTPSAFLKNATATTGGTITNTTRSRVESDLRRVISDINSRYTLVYQSRGTRSGWRTIAIDSRRAGIEIASARKGYFAE